MTYLSEKNQRLQSLTEQSARAYILGSGYFHDGFVLPGRVNPGDFNTNLNPIDWSKKDSVPRTNSLDIIVDKADHGVRRYSLIHPYVYWHLANEFINNLGKVKELLLQNSSVEVYSLPDFSGDSSYQDWLHFSRIDLSANFWKEFKFVANADIHNFYESIYTHSIAWAIEGKDVAKSSRGYELTGNRIDRLFQNAHDGQTNGIPTGNVLSDLAAELILKDIDKLLEPTIVSVGAKAYRYRDDYRFVCKDKGDALLLVDTLAYYLNTEYGLTLNKIKTKIQTNEEYMKSIAGNYVVPDFLSSKDNLDHFSWSNFYRFLIDSKTLNSKKRGSFDQFIEKFIDSVRSMDSPMIITDSLDDWIDVIYATVIDAIESGVTASSHIYLTLDFILSHLADVTARGAILDDLISRIHNSHNEVRVAWTYALLTRFDGDKAAELSDRVNSPLLKFIVNRSTADIDKFTSRDDIPDDDKNILRSVPIFDFGFINSINTIDAEDLILSSMNDELYESMSLSHYVDR